jgi:polyribonucleotide nucleotidyltransferase
MNIGDEIEVKVNEIDSQGRVNLVRNDMTYSKTPMASGNRDSGPNRRPPRRDGRPNN